MIPNREQDARIEAQRKYKTSKLRPETIKAIIAEVRGILAHIKRHNPSSIEELVTVSRGVCLCSSYFGESYVDFTTPHAEITVVFCKGAFQLGTIEVWEDEELCGSSWTFEQIKNNEVEFITSYE